MRIRFRFASEGALIPFAYQDALRSVLHRWLGEQNLWHGQVRSKFGFSNLLNLRAVGRHGLQLRHDADTVDWIVGFYDSEPALRMLERGIELRYGFGDLNLVEVHMEREPAVLPQELRVLSPVLVKTLAGNEAKFLGLSRWDHLLPSDPDHAEHLTASFRRKLADVGLDATGIELRMAEPFQTKLIKIKDTLNRCAVSPVTLIGTDEQLRFARQVGIGHSTGCGFGFLE